METHKPSDWLFIGMIFLFGWIFGLVMELVTTGSAVSINGTPLVSIAAGILLVFVIAFGLQRRRE